MCVILASVQACDMYCNFSDPLGLFYHCFAASTKIPEPGANAANYKRWHQPKVELYVRHPWNTSQYFKNFGHNSINEECLEVVWSCF